MPIDRPRAQPDQPDEPQDRVRPSFRDTPRPPVPDTDRVDDSEPTDKKRDDAQPPADAPVSDRAPNEHERQARQWGHPGEDSDDRYQRALEATAAGDALLDRAVQSLKDWSKHSNENVASYWHTDRRANQTAADDNPTACSTENGGEDGDKTLANLWDTPGIEDLPERPDVDSIHLDAIRRTHILDGDGPDKPGGGHRYGTGKPGKTEFPADWSTKQVCENIVSVARSPDQTPEQQPNKRWNCVGTRDHVELTVITLPDGRIWTAWPEPGSPGVTKNPKET